MTDNESSPTPELKELDLTELHIDREEEPEDTNTRKKSDDAMEKPAQAGGESSSSAPEKSPSGEEGKKETGQPRVNFNTSIITTTNIPFVTIAIIILGLLIGISGIMIYFKDSNALRLAELYRQQTNSYVQNKEFHDAMQSAQTARTAMNKVLLLRFRKNAMEEQISTLLNSTDFKQGLLGQVKFKDTYLPQKTATQVGELEKLTDKADALLRENKIEAALTAYRDAEKYARENELPDREQAIQQTIDNLNLKKILAKANIAENARKWEEAAETYRHALQLSRKLSDTKTTSVINKKLTAITFHHALDQARAAFSRDQWQQTIELLENAEKTLDKNSKAASAEEYRELERLLGNSRLHRILFLARQDYENQQWDKALAKYQKALDLLKDNKDAFSDRQKNAAVKIEKTMLMIKIYREENAATMADQQNDPQSALAHYKAIEQLIGDSDLSKDTSLLAVEKKTRDRIRSKVSQLETDNNIRWLNEHFETIFKNAYPSSHSSKLSDPTITFIKEIRGNRVFKITCLEQSGGSSFRLELNYQYNPARDAWSIFNDQ